MKKIFPWIGFSCICDNCPLCLVPKIWQCSEFSHFAPTLLFCVLCVLLSLRYLGPPTLQKSRPSTLPASTIPSTVFSLLQLKNFSYQMLCDVHSFPFHLSEMCFICQPISIMIFKLFSREPFLKTHKHHCKVFSSPHLLPVPPLGLISQPYSTILRRYLHMLSSLYYFQLLTQI